MSKNNVSAASIAAKIGLAIVFLALIGAIVYFASKCKIDDKPYYECEIYQYQYKNGSTSQVMDLLDGVEYCYLYINKDDTFSLKWKRSDNENVVTEVGTFTNKKNEYTFKFTQYPQLGLQQEFHLTLNGKTFTGDDVFSSTLGTEYTVVAKFTK